MTGTVHVNLVDLFGSTVKTVTFNGNAMTINTDEIPAGTYTLTVNVNGVVTTKRIIINR
ncbi:MAG: T9SS type A sorting domain-containing protein [bacterium]